jgi:hypothetical protein
MTADSTTPVPAARPLNQAGSYVYGFPVSHLRGANTNPSGLTPSSAEEGRQPITSFSSPGPVSATIGDHSGRGSLNRFQSDGNGLAGGSENGGAPGAGVGPGSGNMQSDQQLFDLLWSEVGSLPTWNFEDGRAWWWEGEDGDYGTREDSYYDGRSLLRLDSNH